MVRLALRGAVGVLFAALATACLGGQTGQPTSGGPSCAPSDVSPTASWSGTTVEAAAQALEGPYTGSLRWQVEPRSTTTHTPVDLADNALLALVYTGATASKNDCGDQLIVPVFVTLSTSSSGLAETGEATLTIVHLAQGLVGNLHYESNRVRLDATLPDAGAAAALRVSLDALDPALPGASASVNEGP
jgi:hypothetical protein